MRTLKVLLKHFLILINEKVIFLLTIKHKTFITACKVKVKAMLEDNKLDKGNKGKEEEAIGNKINNIVQLVQASKTLDKGIAVVGSKGLISSIYSSQELKYNSR